MKREKLLKKNQLRYPSKAEVLWREFEVGPKVERDCHVLVERHGREVVAPVDFLKTCPLVHAVLEKVDLGAGQRLQTLNGLLELVSIFVVEVAFEFHERLK